MNSQTVKRAASLFPNSFNKKNSSPFDFFKQYGVSEDFKSISELLCESVKDEVTSLKTFYSSLPAFMKNTDLETRDYLLNIIVNPQSIDNKEHFIALKALESKLAEKNRKLKSIIDSKLKLNSISKKVNSSFAPWHYGGSWLETTQNKLIDVSLCVLSVLPMAACAGMVIVGAVGAVLAVIPEVLPAIPEVLSAMLSAITQGGSKSRGGEGYWSLTGEVCKLSALWFMMNRPISVTNIVATEAIVRSGGGRGTTYMNTKAKHQCKDGKPRTLYKKGKQFYVKKKNKDGKIAYNKVTI